MDDEDLFGRLANSAPTVAPRGDRLRAAIDEVVTKSRPHRRPRKRLFVAGVLGGDPIAILVLPVVNAATNCWRGDSCSCSRPSSIASGLGLGRRVRFAVGEFPERTPGSASPRPASLPLICRGFCQGGMFERRP